jgi:putative (di)nucleoside polyphosphate hydrolase
MVLNDRDQLFVGQRYNGGEWQMPQGGIDEFEDPLKAAYRELYEETSIRSVELLQSWDAWQFYDLPIDILKNVSWGHHFKGQKQKWFLFRFTGSMDEINIKTPHPEFEHYEFWSPKKIMNEIVSFKKEVYHNVFTHFGLIEPSI